MSQTTVIDVPTTSSFSMMSALKVIDEIQPAQNSQNTPEMLPALLEQHFPWFSEENKQVVLEHMEAILLAHRMRLPVQVRTHMSELVNYATKDVAERVAALAVQQLGYQSQCFSYPSAAHQRGRRSTAFRMAGESHWWGTPRTEWLYEPIERFSQMMPLRALRAMAMLEQSNLVPHAYWVADKVAIRTRLSLDPVLYAQYGPWFVGLAEWL